MNLIRAVFVFLGFVLFTKGYAQTYSVGNYRKINAINNGFTGNLDNSDFFGVSSDGIGDLDGDGVADMIVGAFGDDDGGADKGAVWILFMNADGTVKTQRKISDTAGGFTGALDAADFFGGGVAHLGDMNGDGFTEVSVTADYDGDGGYWNGAFYMLSLNPDGSVRSEQKISAFEGGFTGFLAGDNIFGTDVENIGDLDGDGVQDLAVGARRYDLGGADKGVVFILFMNADQTVRDHVLIGEGSGGFGASLSGSDYFGGAIANIGDLDSDGVVDIAVGAYRDNDGGSNSGSVYILFLRSDGTVKRYQKISNTSGNFPFTIPSDALFGESLDGVLDLDGDGLPEILAGSMKDLNETLNANTGAFYLIELQPSGMVSEAFKYTYNRHCFQGELNSGDLFGGSVAIVDPGVARLVAGAYGDSENGSRQGAAWVLDLKEVVSAVTVKDPGRCAVSGAGEITVDGLVPDADYTFSYVYEGATTTGSLLTDNSGVGVLAGLSGGDYLDLRLTLGGQCEKILGDLTLKEVDLDPVLGLEKETGCDTFDGKMMFSGFAPGEEVRLRYELRGALQTEDVLADTEGVVRLEGLGSGVYAGLEVVTNDGCVFDFGEVTLERGDVYFVYDIVQPVSCSVATGTLEFNVSLAPGRYDYVYNHEGAERRGAFDVDDDGNGVIEDLPSGLISGMVLNPGNEGCSFQVGDFEVLSGLSAVDHQLKIPSDCDLADGQFELRGVDPGAVVQYRYTFQGVVSSGTLTAAANGVLVLNDLAVGTYTDVLFSMNDCEWSLPSFELGCRVELSCVEAPEFFSPNGDGINEYWEVLSDSPSCFTQVYIYDRYGKLLYGYRYGDRGWNGEYQGVPMPQNDYWYRVFLSDGRSVKGHFSLRR